MKIDSKDYGVLFKLLVAGRITELDKLLEEISPGHFWEWPIEFSCWFWPKWTKKQIMKESTMRKERSVKAMVFGVLSTSVIPKPAIGVGPSLGLILEKSLKKNVVKGK